MAWVALQDTIWTHYKTLKLSEKLDIPLVQTVGHLVSLWHFTMAHKPENGDLSDWGDSGIELAAKWRGDDGVFANGCREVGYLDDKTIHGWEKHTLHYAATLEQKERRLEKARIRVKRFRDRRKQAQNKADCNAHVTHGNSPVTKCNATTLPYPTLSDPTIPNPTKEVTCDFEVFWKAYPRKVAKPVAKKSWSKVGVPLQVILDAIEIHKKSEQWSKDKGRFIPHPATWLNQRRWEDQIKPAVSDSFVDSNTEAFA